MTLVKPPGSSPGGCEFKSSQPLQIIVINSGGHLPFGKAFIDSLRDNSTIMGEPPLHHFPTQLNPIGADRLQFRLLQQSSIYYEKLVKWAFSQREISKNSSV